MGNLGSPLTHLGNPRRLDLLSSEVGLAGVVSRCCDGGNILMHLLHRLGVVLHLHQHLGVLHSPVRDTSECYTSCCITTLMC